MREKRDAKRKVPDPGPTQDTYNALLRDKVTSTRTTFGEFSSKHSNDERFSAFAATVPFTRLVELFDKWIAELTRKKRKAAKQADDEFSMLLTEKLPPARTLVRDKHTVSSQEAANV